MFSDQGSNKSSIESICCLLSFSMVGHEGTVGAEAVARPKVMSCHVVSRHVLRAELALPRHIEPEIRFRMGSPQLKQFSLENNLDYKLKTTRKQLENSSKSLL